MEKTGRKQWSNARPLHLCLNACSTGLCLLVCACSIRTPACFSTFLLSGVLRSQGGEWRGHIRRKLQRPHPPSWPPPLLQYHPLSLFPFFYPPSSHPLTQLIVPSLWHLGEGWGRGMQEWRWVCVWQQAGQVCVGTAAEEGQVPDVKVHEVGECIFFYYLHEVAYLHLQNKCYIHFNL